jgi:hypothetical protein
VKKEAAAPPPPAYQLPHHCEHVYSPDNLDLSLTYLQYLKFSDYQVVSIKNTKLFAIHILVDDSLYVFGRWCVERSTDAAFFLSLLGTWERDF